MDHPGDVFDNKVSSCGYKSLRDLPPKLASLVRSQTEAARIESQGVVDNLRLKSHLESRYIYVGFTLDAELTAFTFEQDNVGYIASSAFSTVLLDIAFNRMLAEPSVLPELGDPSEETANLPRFNILARNPNYYGIDFRPDEFLKFRPRNKVRRAYAEFLRIWSAQFLLEHEFAHLVFGHCGFLLEESSQILLDEFGTSDPHLKYRLMRQSLEVHADYGAFSHLLKSMLNACQMSAAAPPQLRAVLEDPIKSLSMMVFAVYLLFRFWVPEKTDLDDLTIGHHPAVLIRIGFLVGCMIASLKEQSPDLSKQAAMIFTSMITKAESSIATVTGATPLDPQRDVIDVMYDQRSQTHAADLEQRLAVLAPSLERYRWLKASSVAELPHLLRFS